MEFGCELADAGLEWNATYNDTLEGENSPFEMTRVLSENAASMTLNAIQTITATRSQSLSWAGLLTDKMSSCVNANGHTALQSAIQSLKTTLCSSGQSAALLVARIYFQHWYQFVTDVCVEVIDSHEVDKAALLGAQFYDKMSNMVTGIFWHAFDALTSTWSHSACQPKCDLLHPRFFLTSSWRTLPFKFRYSHPGHSDRDGQGDVTRLQRKSGKCCGMQNNGYLCGLGEGPCQLNSDCATGLMCGTNNCLWSKDESCCTTPDTGNAYVRMQDFSRTTGYTELANMWDYND